MRDEIEEAIAALSELEGSKPKEPPRYVMSRDYVAMIHNSYDASVACSSCGTKGGFGLYDDLDHARFCPNCGGQITEQVDAKGNRTPHPLYDSAPPNEQGAEPVAWMTTDGITIDDAMKQLLPERYSDYSQPLFTAATARTVSIDQIVDVVKQWVMHHGEFINDDLNEDGRSYMADLRRRFEALLNDKP